MKPDKAWARSSRSKRPSILTPGVINYVFCEGETTEIFYAMGIKSLAETLGRVVPGKLIIDDSASGHGGKKLVQEVEKIIDVKRKEFAKSSNNKIANVFIFFDDDGLGKNYTGAFLEIDRINKEEKQRKTGDQIVYHPCWSSYCFEEWLLLHFNYCETAFNEKTLEEKLSECLGEKYDKTDPSIFKKVTGESNVNLRKALNNAEKLNKAAKKHGDEHRNPSTGVPQFVKFFLPDAQKK